MDTLHQEQILFHLKNEVRSYIEKTTTALTDSIQYSTEAVIESEMEELFKTGKLQKGPNA